MAGDTKKITVSVVPTAGNDDSSGIEADKNSEFVSPQGGSSVTDGRSKFVYLPSYTSQYSQSTTSSNSGISSVSDFSNTSVGINNIPYLIMPVNVD